MSSLPDFLDSSLVHQIDSDGDDAMCQMPMLLGYSYNIASMFLRGDRHGKEAANKKAAK